MSNTWDFYKPALASEFPELDGQLSLKAYLGALEEVYKTYKRKEERLRAKSSSSQHRVSLEDFDYVAFHAPYGKMVQKAFARLAYLDFVTSPEDPKFASVDPAIAGIPTSKTLSDKDIEKTFIALTKDSYKSKVWPTTNCMRRCGNMYTAALYGCFASLISTSSPELIGKRVGLFSFGSGLASSFFAVKIRSDVSFMAEKMDLIKRLAAVQVRPCEEYITALELREHKHNINDYVPDGDISPLTPNTYYLLKSDNKYRRTYGIIGR